MLQHEVCLTEVSEQWSNEAAPLDSQADAVIEVKGNKSSVTVSWDNKGEEGEAHELTEETHTMWPDQVLLCHIFSWKKYV